jgi:alpha-tubulin suppressor-like RCC1 family protein
MHFTRRLLDPHRSGLIVALSVLAASAAAVSCSSTDDPSESPLADAGVDGADTDAADAAADSGGRDAGTFDGRPQPVVCESSPCATALVTTLGRSVEDKAEGFCVLLDDGTVACWGANGAGQLGRGESEGAALVDSSTAAKVVGLSNVTSLDRTCAVDKSGSVWCWGTGPFSWSEDGAGVATHTTPVKLALPPVTKVARSFETACAVVGAGVQCWGSNALGQLGPLTETSSGEPKRAALPDGAAASALEVGNATFVLREDGSVVSWGGNPGIGRVSPSFPDPLPQLVSLARVTQIDSAYDNTCAVANGVGYCWGARVTPFKGTVIDRALPEPVATPEPLVQIATTRSEGYFLYGDNNVRDFKPYRWCAVGDSGSVYCWGFNESGQAGTGTEEYVTRAAMALGLPEKALVAQVKTTVNTTCALLTSGKVYCWGSNYNGQLGNGLNRGKSLAPTEVVLP